MADETKQPSLKDRLFSNRVFAKILHPRTDQPQITGQSEQKQTGKEGYEDSIHFQRLKAKADLLRAKGVDLSKGLPADSLNLRDLFDIISLHAKVHDPADVPVKPFTELADIVQAHTYPPDMERAQID